MKSYLTFLFISFSLFSFSQVANDSCFQAVVLPITASGYAQTQGSTAGATASILGTGIQDYCMPSITPVKDVWYSFTTGSGAVLDFIFTIKTCTGSGKPAIGLYRGFCTPAMQVMISVSCGNPDPNIGIAEMYAFGLDPSTTYFVRVANQDVGDMAFDLEMEGYTGGFKYVNSPQTVIDTNCNYSYYNSFVNSASLLSVYNMDTSFNHIIAPTTSHSGIRLDFRDLFIDTLSNGQLEVYRDTMITPDSLVAVFTGDIGDTSLVIQTSGSVMVRLVLDSLMRKAPYLLKWSCDNLSSPTVQINHYSATATICEGENYLGHTVSGTYIDTLSSVVTGCDSIQTLQLTVLPRSLNTLVESICQGDSYLGYITTGLYNDTLTAYNGCDSIRTIDLTVLNLPTATVTEINDSTLQSSSGASYQWFLNGIMIANANSQTYQPTQSGTFTVEVTDANGCVGVSSDYLFIASSIERITDDYNVQILPNPNNGQFILELKDLLIGEWQLEVFDVTGKLIKSENVQLQGSVERISIDLMNTVDGLYLLRMMNTDGHVIVRKFIID